MDKVPLILASASPRRRELLGMIANEFLVMTAHVDEETLMNNFPWDDKKSFHEQVKGVVVRLSGEKARQVATNRSHAMVIGADTVVVLGDRLLGKPADREEAFQMIRSLAGQTHVVMTGVTVCFNENVRSFVSETNVRFIPWDRQMEEEVMLYVEQGLPLDKAGAYGIQEAAGLWVDWMEGDYFNVVGLPVAKLNRVMAEMLADK